MMCEICNIEFNRTSNRQKYCINCSKNEKQKSRKKSTERWYEQMKKTNPERLRKLDKAKQDRWRKKHWKKWYQNNKVKVLSRGYTKRNNQIGNICFICENKENLQFHHTSYKNNKGFTVCKDCHKYIHKTFGIQDEPIPSRTEEEFKAALKKKAEILRNVAEEELKLINSLPK